MVIPTTRMEPTISTELWEYNTCRILWYWAELCRSTCFILQPHTKSHVVVWLLRNVVVLFTWITNVVYTWIKTHACTHSPALAFCILLHLSSASFFTCPLHPTTAVPIASLGQPAAPAVKAICYQLVGAAQCFAHQSNITVQPHLFNKDNSIEEAKRKTKRKETMSTELPTVWFSKC